jgi:predicted glycoside hydrolase/deacetylase ChbG (UPF0249 family)
MLIINADDYGRSKRATDNILHCYKRGRINTASGMVFMADSERSAERALECNIDVGLHLNFTEHFSGRPLPDRLVTYQKRIATFLSASKFAFIVYNPMLSNCFDYVFKAQYEEYGRLFKRGPLRIDGHEHMHLCSNVIAGKMIPAGTIVRRNFSFRSGEKSGLNRLYRNVVDFWLKRRHFIADYFFALSMKDQFESLLRPIELARRNTVELMVHPEKDADFVYLNSDRFGGVISSVMTGSYMELCGAAPEV